MRLRPWWRWKLLWLGGLGFAFLLWLWGSSLADQWTFQWQFPGLKYAQVQYGHGRVALRWGTLDRPGARPWDLSREVYKYPGPWISGGEQWGHTSRSAYLSFAVVVPAYVAAWGVGLWLWRRRKRRLREKDA